MWAKPFPNAWNDAFRTSKSLHENVFSCQANISWLTPVQPWQITYWHVIHTAAQNDEEKGHR